MKKDAFRPGSGAAIELMRAGLSYDEKDELAKWVALLADITKKNDSQAFIDEYWGLFARRQNAASRLSIISLAFKNRSFNPERVLAYPVFENFVRRLAEDGVIKGSDQNIYFADYDADDMIMGFAQFAWDQASAIFPEGEGWKGDSARLMCVNSAASLYLDRLYELKRNFGDYYEKNPQAAEKLAEEVLSGKFSNARRMERVKGEEKYTPFMLESIRLNTAVLNEIRNNCALIAAGREEQMKKFGSRKSLPNERYQAVGKSWDLVSSLYQSMTSASAIKEIGYETFAMKAEEIGRKIAEKSGGICPKKAQLAVKLASGKAADLDWRWLDDIALAAKDPFGFNIDKRDEMDQKVFALACGAAKSRTDASYLCQRIGERAAQDPALSVLDMADARNQVCANAAFFALGKSLSSGIPEDEQKEGEDAWKRIKSQNSGGHASFMRQ